MDKAHADWSLYSIIFRSGAGDFQKRAGLVFCFYSAGWPLAEWGYGMIVELGETSSHTTVRYQRKHNGANHI